MKTYSKAVSTADSNAYQKAYLDSIFENEENRIKSVKSISYLKKIENFTKPQNERKASPFVKLSARARKANVSVGRLPSRRPIKSPRLEPPRYVNALPSKEASDTEESDFNSQETTPATACIRACISKLGCPEVEQVRRDSYQPPVIGLHDLPKIHEIEDGWKDTEEEDPKAVCADRPDMSPCVSPEILLDSPPLLGLPYRNSTLLHKNAIPIERFLPPKDISAITEYPSPEALQMEQENTPAVKASKAVPRRPRKSKRAIRLTKAQPVKTSTMYEPLKNREQSLSFEDVLSESTILKVPGAPNGETVSCVEGERMSLSQHNISHRQQVKGFPEKFSSTQNMSGIEAQMFSVELSSVHETVREGELPVQYSRFVNSDEIVPIYGEEGSQDIQNKSGPITPKNRVSQHRCMESSKSKQRKLDTTTPTSFKPRPKRRTCKKSKNYIVQSPGQECAVKSPGQECDVKSPGQECVVNSLEQECVVKSPVHECIVTSPNQECTITSPVQECIICTFPEDLPLKPACLKQSVISVAKMKKNLRNLRPIPDDVLLDD